MSHPPAETTEPDADRSRGAAGFAGLPIAERRRIAAEGGRAAHACGKAHEFSSREASLAGRIGGLQVSADRSHMARLGRLGAARRLLLRRAAEQQTISCAVNAAADRLPTQQPGASSAKENHELKS